MSCWEWMPLWPDPFRIPLSGPAHGSLHVAGTLMAFKCLSHAHTTLVGLVLSWKEDKERDPHPFGWQLLGRSEQRGLWNTPEGNPSPSSSVASIALACFQRVPMRKEKQGDGGRDPKVPVWATKNVVVWAQVGKEFPDTRQDERRIKFMRVGSREWLPAQWAGFLIVRESRQ